jgi:hypothetical protein
LWTVLFALYFEPQAIIHGIRNTPDFHSFVVALIMEVPTVLAGIAFGKAWWVLRRNSPPAKTWCIAGSLMSLILPIGFPSLYLFNHPNYPEFWRTAKFFAIPVAIGLVSFLFSFTDAAKPFPPEAAKASH